MHELSIAAALLEQILEEASRHQLTKVERVELQTGFLRQVIPDVMEAAFREVTAGTLAENAELAVKEIPAQARCRQCQKIFEPTLMSFLCPQCQKADVDILKGNEIILASVSGM